MSSMLSECFSFHSDFDIVNPESTCPKEFDKYYLGSHFYSINREYSTEVLSTQTKQELKLRKYQLELAEQAVQGVNSIICAPTGSGKTFVVGEIIQNLFKPNFKAVFLVNQRILVDQQKNALVDFFKRYAPSSGPTNLRIGNNPSDLQLSDVFQHYDILVLTAQKLINALREEDISIGFFNLIIFDECHHVDLKHPYNNIMLNYLEQKLDAKATKLPQILGITATLGVGKNDVKEHIIDHHIKMCANLDCFDISYVRKNQAELDELSYRPLEDIIIRCEPKKTDENYGKELKALLVNIAEIAFPDFNPVFEPGTQMYEQQAVQLKKYAEKHQQYLGFVAEVLIHINRAFMIHIDFSAQDSFQYVREFFHDGFFHDSMDSRRLCVRDLWEGKKDELEKLAGDEADVNNPKMDSLAKLLVKIFYEKPEARGMILTRTKYSVDILLKFLGLRPDLEDICKAKKLVGHSEMTDAEQDAAIRNFSSDDCNLIVATDVAQEGLDLRACNFVIRYNFVSNEIGSMQSRGRARAPASKSYLLIDKNSPDLVRELRNAEREKMMKKTLEEMDGLRNREKLIEDKQLHQWRMHKQRMESNQIEKTISSELVIIVCKNCKQELCRGDEIKKRGSNYVCTKSIESFGDIVRAKKQTIQHYRTESRIGKLYCNGFDCKDLLGQILEYPFGKEYSFKKDCVMFGVLERKTSPPDTPLPPKDGYNEIKNWSKVPFEVPESKLFGGKYYKSL